MQQYALVIILSLHPYKATTRIYNNIASCHQHAIKHHVPTNECKKATLELPGPVLGLQAE